MKGLLIGIGILVVLALGIYAASASFYQVHTTTITVKNHFPDTEGSTTYYIVVATNGRQFEVQNVFDPFIAQANADNLWTNVQNGATYCITTVGFGWSVPWAQTYWYPNIVQMTNGTCA